MSDTDSARVPEITSRDQLAPGDREHFDSIEESRGGVRGPFRLLLHSPEVAGRTGRQGAYIRFGNRLRGSRGRLAILTTAREFDCA
jgi:4-carboxymuconolactone decarboxylase